MNNEQSKELAGSGLDSAPDQLDKQRENAEIWIAFVREVYRNVPDDTASEMPLEALTIYLREVDRQREGRPADLATYSFLQRGVLLSILLAVTTANNAADSGEQWESGDEPTRPEHKIYHLFNQVSVHLQASMDEIEEQFPEYSWYWPEAHERLTEAIHKTLLN